MFSVKNLIKSALVAVTLIGSMAGVAVAKDYTMKVPSGVPDGSTFELYGQGWGQKFTVQGGRVTIPGDIGASSVFGNFKKPDGSYLKVENLNSVPPTWGAIVKNGNCQGSRPVCSGVEAFVNSGDGTFALVAPIATENKVSQNRIVYSNGTVTFTPPVASNSSSWSGVRERTGFALPTGGPKGLINWGQLINEGFRPAVAYQGSDGKLTFALMQGGGGSYSFSGIRAGQEFQVVLVQNSQIYAWSTVGASITSGVSKNDGTGRTVLGPFTYTAR